MAKLGRIFRFSLPGLVLVGFTFVFFWLLLPLILHSEISKQVRLVEETDTWNKWKEAPIPIYLSFYIQSVTNPDDVENGRKAVFEEKGPYSYLQKRRKVSISQQDGENTVTYKEVKTFFFDPEHSLNNSEDDLVTIPNIPFVSVIHTVKKMVPLDVIAGIVGNVILKGEPLMRRNIPVREVLFQGFDVTKYTKSVLASQLPKEFSGGRFGLYKGKNATAGEEWEVYTGVDDPKNFGQIKTWDGKYALGFWKPHTECDRPTGSDGSVFAPFITQQTVLQVFAPDICRSLPLVYEGETEFLDIPGYRFTVAREALDDPTLNSANECYCLETKIEKCAFSGVLPLESCLKAPIFASTPHFLGASERFSIESGQEQAVESLHKTYIDVEPNTGMLLRARKRLQFGIEIRSNRKVHALQNFTKEPKTVYFPMVWAEESADIDDNLADFVKGQLVTPLKIAAIAKWALLTTGLILSVLGVGYAMKKHTVRNLDKKDKVDLTRPSTTSSVSSISYKIGESSAMGTQDEVDPPSELPS